jgi:hypothetical protein
MTMTSPAATDITQRALSDQLAYLMGQVAGYVGNRTIAIGLRTGLVPSSQARRWPHRTSSPPRSDWTRSAPPSGARRPAAPGQGW